MSNQNILLHQFLLTWIYSKGAKLMLEHGKLVCEIKLLQLKVISNSFTFNRIWTLRKILNLAQVKTCQAVHENDKITKTEQ